MNFAMIAGVVRHLAGLAGSYLMTAGYLAGDSEVQMFVGGVVAVASIAWSILDKKFGWSTPAA